MFTPLGLNAIEEIVEKFITQLSKRLANQDISLEISDPAKLWIAKTGYDSAYGARPLERFITNHVETPLAKEIIAGKVMPHSKVTITLGQDNNLIFATETTD